MRDEIEDLHALADECREWRKSAEDIDSEDDYTSFAMEFKRLADKLDAIAKRLTEKET